MCMSTVLLLPQPAQPLLVAQHKAEKAAPAIGRPSWSLFTLDALFCFFGLTHSHHRPPPPLQRTLTAPPCIGRGGGDCCKRHWCEWVVRSASTPCIHSNFLPRICSRTLGICFVPSGKPLEGWARSYPPRLVRTSRTFRALLKH